MWNKFNFSLESFIINTYKITYVIFSTLTTCQGQSLHLPNSGPFAIRRRHNDGDNRDQTRSITRTPRVGRLSYLCLRLFQLEHSFRLFKIEADNEQGWFILGFELSCCSLVCLHIVTMVALKDVPPTPDAALLLPRRYQEEIFRRSQEDNVIAALDTGSGKTFISTLLIKWMSIQEHAQGKAILFLVPKVALVEQQGDFIATQTPLRVKKLRGSLEMDLTDRAKWREAFESADVLVMTGKVSQVIWYRSSDFDKIREQHKYLRIFSHTRTGVSTRSVVSFCYGVSSANIRFSDLPDRL
jgi:hypothetical protein